MKITIEMDTDKPTDHAVIGLLAELLGAAAHLNPPPAPAPGAEAAAPGIDVGAQRDQLERMIGLVRACEGSKADRLFELLAPCVAEIGDYVELAGGLQAAMRATWSGGRAEAPEEQAAGEALAADLAASFLARWTAVMPAPLPYAWTRARPATELSLSLDQVT